MTVSETLALAMRAANGDADARDRLLAMHLPALRAFVRVHMGPKLRAMESTSDLVQSVCREVLDHAERFQHADDHGFRTWLFTSARRKIANRLRDVDRLKRGGGRFVASLDASGAAQLGGAYAQITSPSQVALRAEDIERLEQALDRLSDEHREVITLAHLVGLDRAAIGAQLGKSEEAVRSLLHRAMARLTILLGDAEQA